MPSGSDWTFLLLTGVFTQLGQTFMTMALQQEKASGIVNLQYTGVIFSLIFGFFIFNESYPLLSFAGMMLIILGIILNFFYTKYKASPSFKVQGSKFEK
jgi:uncharacterized membrane protein